MHMCFHARFLFLSCDLGDGSLCCSLAREIPQGNSLSPSLSLSHSALLSRTLLCRTLFSACSLMRKVRRSSGWRHTIESQFLPLILSVRALQTRAQSRVQDPGRVHTQHIHIHIHTHKKKLSWPYVPVSRLGYLCAIGNVGKKQQQQQQRQ